MDGYARVQWGVGRLDDWYVAILFILSPAQSCLSLVRHYCRKLFRGRGIFFIKAGNITAMVNSLFIEVVAVVVAGNHFLNIKQTHRQARYGAQRWVRLLRVASPPCRRQIRFPMPRCRWILAPKPRLRRIYRRIQAPRVEQLPEGGGEAHCQGGEGLLSAAAGGGGGDASPLCPSHICPWEEPRCYRRRRRGGVPLARERERDETLTPQFI